MKPIKTFQFTIVLKHISEDIDNLEDSLYEAGCDDALINFRNGAIYLNFDREAFSLEEAVVSAIKNIQSIDIEVTSIAPDNLVTESEIAKRLEVTRQTVSLWIKGKRRQSFPSPVMRLSEKSPLWKWTEVTEWLYENKIITDKKVVEDALFFVNINAALEERDIRTRKIRHNLLERISLRP